MFSKSVRLGRAVPVTSLALAASLMVSLQAQAPADRAGPGEAAPPTANVCRRRARFSIATSRPSADARRSCRTSRPTPRVRSACPRRAWWARSRHSARRTPTASWSGSRSPASARWPMASTARTAGSMTPMTGPDAEGRQGARSDEARRRFLQRAARPEEVPEHQDGREDRLRGPALLQGQPHADSTATRTSTSTTSRPDCAPAASARASPRWARSPRPASKGTTRSSATCCRRRRWCRR